MSMRQEHIPKPQVTWKPETEQSNVLTTPLVESSEKQTETTDDFYARQIVMLEQKASLAATADEVAKYLDIIKGLRKEMQEHTLAPILAQRQASEARLMQITAATVCILPGLSLIAAAVYLHDASLTVTGGPLVAIGAASLSERVATVAKVWLDRRGYKNDKS